MLTAAIACTESPSLHVVLVLDRSASMAGDRIEGVKEAGWALIDLLDLAADPETRVGVVEFYATARTVCELTNDRGRAVACVADVAAGGSGTKLDLALEEGLKVLRRGRSSASDRDSIREVMVLVADDPDSSGCSPAVHAAGAVKGQQVLLSTVSLGPDADKACLLKMATDPGDYFEARQADHLTGVFQRIHAGIADIVASRLVITDVVPANMIYVPGNPSDTWDPTLRQLSWTTSPVGRQGVTHTFKVWPQDVGLWPTNVNAEAVFVDLVNAEGRFTFNVPDVTVWHGTATSSATPPPSATPTGPPPRGGQLFLPYLRR
jgi:uncharacterized protein YegL